MSNDATASSPPEPPEKPTAVGWLARRARRAAQVLKDEYEAGRRGEEEPAQTIWATPREQLDALMGMMRGAGNGAARDGVAEAGAGRPDDASTDACGAGSSSIDSAGADGSMTADDAEQVAGALRGVDWSGVRAATSDRTSEAARAARAMADQVDWQKVQPAAQKVSKALIAAVASGQIPVIGPFGSLIARAIVDQGGMARRVGGRLDEQHSALPADVDSIIETTAREA